MRNTRKGWGSRTHTAGKLAVVVTVLIVIATGCAGPPETETRAMAAGAETGASGTGLANPPPTEPIGPGWDGQGLPPKRAVASTPTTGKVIAEYVAPSGGAFVYVYADGRVISHWLGGERIGEQRLAPVGVELVRSGAVDASSFVSSSDPIPADAWEDADVRSYVARRYSICSSGDPSQIVAQLPARAEALLRDEERTFEHSAGQVDVPYFVTCFVVDVDAVREIADAIRAARVRPGPHAPPWPPFQYWEESLGRADVDLTGSDGLLFDPFLPQGDWAACCLR